MALIVTGTVGGLAAKAATQSVTSHDRASSATVPHLPVTDQSSTQSLSCWPTVSSPGSSTRSVRGATVFGSVRIGMTHEERAVRKLEKFRQCGNYFQWSEKYCCRERHRIDIDVSDAHITRVGLPFVFGPVRQHKSERLSGEYYPSRAPGVATFGRGVDRR